MMVARKPWKILVIDDSEVMLARIKRTLLAEGYDVVATTHVVGNARYLPTVDLVLIDYHMPGIDGRSVLESLRSVSTTGPRACKFYVYTSDAAMASRYAELGFDGVVRDKGDFVQLASQLKAFFRLRALQTLRDPGSCDRVKVVDDALVQEARRAK